MSEFKKLKNQPLVCVLMEVRFSSVLNLEHYIAKVQDKVRQRYPHFNQDTEQAINITPDGIAVENSKTYVFTAKEKMSYFQLSTNRLIFATKSYNRFEDFSDRCKELITVISDIINPALFSRIGLRFADCVKTNAPGNDDELRELFDTESVFFAPEISSLGSESSHRTDSTIQVGDGLLSVRTISGMINAVAFEDLMQQKYIEIKADDKPSERVLLDFDHYWQNEEKPRDFVVDDMISSLNKLHTTSRQAFWNITSKHARENVWS